MMYMSTSSSYSYIPESKTTMEYPASGIKAVILDSKGSIISDTHSSPPRINY
jgi:hypothetical protein